VKKGPPFDGVLECHLKSANGKWYAICGLMGSREGNLSLSACYVGRLAVLDVGLPKRQAFVLSPRAGRTIAASECVFGAGLRRMFGLNPQRGAGAARKVSLGQP